MSAVGVFMVLVLAVLVQAVGSRLAPVLMPGGRFRVVIAGWASGVVAGWTASAWWPSGPQVAGTNLVAAAIGTIAVTLVLGIAPFVRILVRK